MDEAVWRSCIRAHFANGGLSMSIRGDFAVGISVAREVICRAAAV